MNDDRIAIERRRLVSLGAAATFGLLTAGCSARARDAHDEKNAEGEGEEKILPPEDLMREHGVLNRLLLVYEEGARRIETPGSPPSLEPVASAAGIIRTFIEGYHEKLEEEHLFPRFEKAGRLVELVAVLRQQHQAGRRVTEDILRLTDPRQAQGADGKGKLVVSLRAFVRMYRPHEAREDTVLFPALRSVVGHKELDELGERFEAKEHELFGKKGFEGIVKQVGALEQQLGIHDLSLFTPT